MEEQDSLKSWEEFNDSEYLEAARVKDNSEAWAIIGVEKDTTTGKVVLELSRDDGELVRKFSLNKTNGKYLEHAGIASPIACIGRVLYFEKVKVTNPSTKQIVDSLQICKVEEAGA